jgi:hypothetical protein
MWVPISIETTSRVNPLIATLRAKTERSSDVSPLVNVRKIGMFSGGLTMGNSAPMMSSVFRVNSAIDGGIYWKEFFCKGFVCQQIGYNHPLLM